MIEVQSLVKVFGSFVAVDSVSFSVPKGQILGFLGPNGAGKSTTMRMITGFIDPTSGTATVGGKDIRTESVEVRKQIGYLPENAPSYGEMTVSEFLAFIAEMRGFRGAEKIRAAEKVKELCFLSGVWHQPIETLSRGFRQRVGFAQAVIHDPPVLILDEPTDGLDPNQKHEVRELIKNMGKDKTIVLSTHILEEVEAVCERVVIIANGKIVADETPMALMSRSELCNAVTLGLASETAMEEARKYLSGLDNISKVETLAQYSNTLRIYPRNRENPISGEISKIAREKHWAIEQIHVERGRLDEVFRKITVGN